jgi:hypothetical protein
VVFAVTVQILQRGPRFGNKLAMVVSRQNALSFPQEELGPHDLLEPLVQAGKREVKDDVINLKEMGEIK